MNPEESPKPEPGDIKALIALGVRLDMPRITLFECAKAVNDMCDRRTNIEGPRLTAKSLQTAALRLTGTPWHKITADGNWRYLLAQVPHEVATAILMAVKLVKESMTDIAMENLFNADEQCSMANALRYVSVVGLADDARELGVRMLCRSTCIEKASVYFDFIRHTLTDEPDKAHALIQQALENL
jgi:hypothetical protein